MGFPVVCNKNGDATAARPGGLRLELDGNFVSCEAAHSPVLVTNYPNACAGFRAANMLTHAPNYNFLMMQATNSANIDIKMGEPLVKNPSRSRAPNIHRACARHAQRPRVNAAAAQRAQASPSLRAHAVGRQEGHRHEGRRLAR